MISLLLVGLAVSRVTEFFYLQGLLGTLLYPVISLSVTVSLFEGRLSLHAEVLQDIGRVIRNLITSDLLETWGISAVAAMLSCVILPLGLALSILIDTILAVSSTTVPGPHRFDRPLALDYTREKDANLSSGKPPHYTHL